MVSSMAATSALLFSVYLEAASSATFVASVSGAASSTRSGSAADPEPNPPMMPSAVDWINLTPILDG